MSLGRRTPSPTRSSSPAGSSGESLTPSSARKRSLDDMISQDAILKIGQPLSPLQSSQPHGDVARDSIENGRKSALGMAGTGQQPQGPLSLPFTSSSPVPEDLSKDPRIPLEPKDWTELESRYQKAITEKQEEERIIYDEYTKLSTFYAYWLAASIHHDVDRASKRLKTQIHWVKHSEQAVSVKQQKYVTAVRAIENAMALV